MKEKFVGKNFRDESLALVQKMASITDKYSEDGLDLTLRQLYYRLVASDTIANTEKSYKRIGDLLADARMAGLVDWSVIVDRERPLNVPQTWNNAAQILRAACYGLAYDHWAHQPNVVEVWVEKKALIGIVNRACVKHRVTRIACKGYMSYSALYRAAKRINKRWEEQEQGTTILYLGDHDPSGLNMPVDIGRRLGVMGAVPIIDRIALTKAQISTYDAPPNIAKLSDSRAAKYIKKHGNSSWELDALEPKVLVALIESEVASWVDPDVFEATLEREKYDSGRIRELAKGFV